MKTLLGFDFRIGHYNDRTPNLTIVVNQSVKKQFDSISRDSLHTDIEVNLPCIITFRLSGRHPNDTVVDATGTVVKDVFVELQQMTLHDVNHCVIPAWALPLSQFEPHDEIAKSGTHALFWSKNGSCALNIDYDDILLWFLSHKEMVLSSKGCL